MVLERRIFLLRVLLIGNSCPKKIDCKTKMSIINFAYMLELRRTCEICFGNKIRDKCGTALINMESHINCIIINFINFFYLILLWF